MIASPFFDAELYFDAVLLLIFYLIMPQLRRLHWTKGVFPPSLELSNADYILLFHSANLSMQFQLKCK